MVPLLRELEHKGMEEDLTTATQLCQQTAVEFERIRIFLEGYLAKHCELADKA